MVSDHIHNHQIVVHGKRRNFHRKKICIYKARHELLAGWEGQGCGEIKNSTCEGSTTILFGAKHISGSHEYSICRFLVRSIK